MFCFFVVCSWCYVHCACQSLAEQELEYKRQAEKKSFREPKGIASPVPAAASSPLNEAALSSLLTQVPASARKPFKKSLFDNDSEDDEADVVDDLPSDIVVGEDSPSTETRSRWSVQTEGKPAKRSWALFGDDEGDSTSDFLTSNGGEIDMNALQDLDDLANV